MDEFRKLGITATSSADDIKKAFRKLAFQFHPDQNKAPDATKKFLEIKRVYEILIKEKAAPQQPIYYNSDNITNTDTGQWKATYGWKIVFS